MSRLHIDAPAILREIDDLVSRHPEMRDDYALRMDMIEGETNATEFLSKVVRAMRSELAMADAITASAAQIASEMETRRIAAERRADTLRELAFRILQVAKPNQPVRLPEATLSLAAVPAKLVIEDEKAIPENCFSIEAVRKLNKAAVKALLDNGQTVPGAKLSAVGQRLNVRVAS